jgi:predicted DCC family thiol-disulfide oxidoreductase YuxK
MPEAPSKSRRLIIYTDGRCRFCELARRSIERYDTDHRLDFRDFNDPQIAAETPYTTERLREEMHVRAPDGSWHTGFYGWIAILSALPERRWLVHLLGLPPMRFMGPAFYRYVARHRYQIPEFILRRFGMPIPCEVHCPVPKDS